MGQREIGLCVLWACVWEGSSPPKMPTKKKEASGDCRVAAMVEKKPQKSPITSTPPFCRRPRHISYFRMRSCVIGFRDKSGVLGAFIWKLTDLLWLNLVKLVWLIELDLWILNWNALD